MHSSRAGVALDLATWTVMELHVTREEINRSSANTKNVRLGGDAAKEWRVRVVGSFEV